MLVHYEPTFLFLTIVYRKNYDKFHIEKFIILFLLNL